MAQSNYSEAPTAQPWIDHADELATWAERYIVRRDVWGGYVKVSDREKIIRGQDGKERPLGKVKTCPPKKHRGVVALTRDVIVRHFRATRPENVIGIHTTSLENVCRFGVVEIDAHGEEGNNPEATTRAALAWYAKAQAAGLVPLLWDSDGKGGFHLDIVFAEPVPSASLFWFMREFVSDFAAFGLPKAPETFPKQPQINRQSKCHYGNWSRLIGRHHTRDVWARVWNGSEWLDSEAAVQFVLLLPTNPATLLPANAEVIGRGREYVRNCPNASEGNGRDDIAYRILATVARDLNGSDTDALMIAEEWDAGNRPPKGRERLEQILANVREYGRNPYGAGLDCNERATGKAAEFSAGACGGTPRPDSSEVDKPGQLVNFVMKPDERPEAKEGAMVRVGLSAPAVHILLNRQSDGWPRRVGPALFVRDSDIGPSWLTQVPDLFGWIQTLFVKAENAVQWADRATGLLSRSEFHAYLKQTVQRYESVESAPHEPLIDGHYYIHPPIAGGDGKALAGLLARFTPHTEDDALLIQSFFLSLFWGGPYGQRPAYLFTGPDDDQEMGRGIGKTTIVRMGGKLVGGTFDIRPTDPWDDIIRRLLSNTECATQRLILIDNVKTHRFSRADVEQLITAERVNGRKMYVGDGRRPNTFTIAITLNGASLSKDLAQRCVIVKLDRPKHSGEWESDTASYIDANRWAIVGDIIAKLRSPAEQLTEFSRWGLWDREILGRLPDPARLMALIQERRAAVDDDEQEADLIRGAIGAELSLRGHGEPDQAGVKIPVAIMAKIVGEALNERLGATGATTKLKAIGGAIPELKHTTSGRDRIWAWRGKEFNGKYLEALRDRPYAGKW